MTFGVCFLSLAVEWARYAHRDSNSKKQSWPKVTALLIGLTVFGTPTRHIIDNAFQVPSQPPKKISRQQAERALTDFGIRISALSKPIEGISAPDAPNLVLLYLESVEANYLDEERFPQLMPFLSSLRKQSTFFHKLSKRCRELYGRGFFVSQCGYPFNILSHSQSGNSALYFENTKSFFCLGDLFEQLDYHNVFIQGSSLRFAGTGHFFKQHGFHEVTGAEKLTGSSKSYAVMHDELFFKNLKTKIKNLSTIKKPFL